MELTFLGAGGSDHDWTRFGEPGILGNASALVNGHILIDCGYSMLKVLEYFKIPYSRITALVLTHTHPDHFQPEHIRKIIGGRKEFDFYGSPEACALLADCCTVHPLEFGDTFSVGSCTFQALPANHTAADWRERTYIYLITENLPVQEQPHTLLYATDTAGLTAQARRILASAYVDAAVWDIAVAIPPDLQRTFEHTRLEQFRSTRDSLTESRNMNARTKHYFTHRIRKFWPESPEEQKKIADREGAILAQEGITIRIGE